VDKLFFVTTRDVASTEQYQVEDDVDTGTDGTVSRLNVDQAERFLETNRDETSGEDGANALELIALGLQAARGGVERVHIVDGSRDGVILQEIFSNFGVGLMIHADRYHSIREMRREDVPDIVRLMAPLIRRGVLIPRSSQDLIDRLKDYVVFETDGMIHGCGALHRYGDQEAEIAAIAVDEKSERFGIGQRMVTYLIGVARGRGIGRVFALTTQSSDWFEQLGFRLGTIADLPAEKQESYDHKRKSRVLLYDLEGGTASE
jgi:amino-acid N-acetyltransferase